MTCQAKISRKDLHNLMKKAHDVNILLRDVSLDRSFVYSKLAIHVYVYLSIMYSYIKEREKGFFFFSFFVPPFSFSPKRVTLPCRRVNVSNGKQRRFGLPVKRNAIH